MSEENSHRQPKKSPWAVSNAFLTRNLEHLDLQVKIHKFQELDELRKMSKIFSTKHIDEMILYEFIFYHFLDPTYASSVKYLINDSILST